MKLILFDIDGTLLNCGPQVRPIFASALIDVYGTAGKVDGYDFAGRADPRVVVALMAAAGVPERGAREKLPRMRELYVERLARSLERERMCLLPGVEDLLERLA